MWLFRQGHAAGFVLFFLPSPLLLLLLLLLMVLLRELSPRTRGTFPARARLCGCLSVGVGLRRGGCFL